VSDTDPDIEILVTDPPPRPPGTPPEFRERIALALKTTSAHVLDAAERDFRGIYPDAEHYVCAQLTEHLPKYMHWLLACCDPRRLRAGYENGALRIWTIPLPDGRVLMFESQAEPGRRRRRS
jgi:hypothetical protein